MKTEAERTGSNLARLRKRVAFELFLRRLVQVAPDRWVLKGALALDFRLGGASRSTKGIDLGRDDDEEAAIEDIAAAQRLRLDDFFTFAASRTDAFDEVDEFQAIRFHVRAELAERVFEQFIVDVGFAKSASSEPDMVRTSDFLSSGGGAGSFPGSCGHRTMAASPKRLVSSPTWQRVSIRPQPSSIRCSPTRHVAAGTQQSARGPWRTTPGNSRDPDAPFFARAR